MILNLLKPYFLIFLAIALSACVTNTTQEKWPNDIPARSIFVDTWKKQNAAGTNDSSLEEHLVWIVRFYEGSVLYPIGWNDMTRSLLDSLDTQQQRHALRPRLRALGQTICIEWAQKNSVRKIDSSAIAVWGNALRTSAERDEQELFVSKVESDVTALLSGDLNYREIVRERYYPPEDYDNF